MNIGILANNVCTDELTLGQSEFMMSFNLILMKDKNLLGLNLDFLEEN
jgi:hypothetical protein